MKSFTKILGITILMFTLFGCSKGSKFDDKFSGDDLKAVKITEKLLPKGAEIEDCEVVRGKLPLALLEDKYKNTRDLVNKARIDYRTCMTRGLNDAAQKNVETLAKTQDQIREKSRSLEESSPEHMFVLAKVKEKRSNNKEGLTGYIAVFDAGTLEKVDMMQVTTPLYNNAVMVTEALNGRLADPSSGAESTSLKSDNPVVAFILGCTPK